MVKKFGRRKFHRRRFGGKFKKRAKKIPMSRMPTGIRPEAKHFIQNGWSAESIDTVAGTPSVQNNLLQIPLGVTYDTRTGYQCFIKGVRCKGYVQGSTSSDFDDWRMDFILDREPGAGLPSAIALFNLVYGTFYSTAQDQLNAVLDPHSRDRFKILRSMRRHNRAMATGIAANPSGASQHHFDVYLKLNRKVHYSQDATAQPYFGCNVFVLAWGTLTMDTPIVYMVTDTCFYDN